MLIDLSGKHAIVTGGESGIGRAIVQTLPNSGAAVHSFDLSECRDSAPVEAAFASVPPPDIVIANAGIVVRRLSPKPPTNSGAAPSTRTLTGAFYALRAAAARMKARGGSIVLTASTNSYGKVQLPPYNASKARLLGLLHAARERTRAVRDSPQRGLPRPHPHAVARSLFSNPDILRDYFRQTPLGRGGEAAEVARPH